MNSSQYKILAAKVDSQNKYWKKNGGVSNETVADAVIALNEAAINVNRIAELENENSVLISSAADCLNDNIIDWVICGMATNGRLKEEWAITHLIKLKEFKKSLEISKSLKEQVK